MRLQLRVDTLAAIAIAAATCTVVEGQLLDPAARAFSFQARLSGPGVPRDGTVDLTINIYAGDVGGPAISGPYDLVAEPISSGMVSAAIEDIDASAFDGQKPWLGRR
ncbi:MAG: hypothetical protein O7F76_10690 [Planctomycetota bacterium]|nr:hypothetical protein [Planctomycetota bacterium]